MRIIFDGDECLTEYVKILSQAKKSIWISMYMLRFDDCTKKLWDILWKKHNEGVKVHVWYDLYGSARSLSTLVRTPFCSAYIPRWYRLGARNHAKIFVIDDKLGVISGRNLTSKYFGEYVDASVVIDDKETLGELKEFQKRIEQNDAIGPTPDGILRYTDPLNWKRTVYNFVLEHIATSKKRIILLSPYFVLDDALENLLLAAADRGVKITIIIPRKPEHRLARTFNRINFQRVHHPNVTVMRSSKGMFHSKVMVFDDVALVGSANFDNRSFKYNTELSVVMDKTHMNAIEAHVNEVAHAAVKYHWIQRAYDSLLFHFTRHLMEFL